jgi:hypothetical protein
MRGFGEIAERLRRSTAQLFFGERRGAGSGVVWSADGLIVNRVLPDDLEGEFDQGRLEQERAYRAEIDRRFPALPRVLVRQLPSDVRGLADLEAVARQIPLCGLAPRCHNDGLTA